MAWHEHIETDTYEAARFLADGAALVQCAYNMRHDREVSISPQNPQWCDETLTYRVSVWASRQATFDFLQGLACGLDIAAKHPQIVGM